MLGPVCLALGLIAGQAAPAPDGVRRATAVPAIHHLVPWFIIGFLALAAARAGGLIPAAWVGPSATASTWLTIVSMAALGLGVDLRASPPPARGSPPPSPCRFSPLASSPSA